MIGDLATIDLFYSLLFCIGYLPHSAHFKTFFSKFILINASHKSGHLEPEEQRLINRVFDFSDADVKQAMVRCVRISALTITAIFSEVKDVFRMLRYSRLPVYRENLEHT